MLKHPTSLTWLSCEVSFTSMAAATVPWATSFWHGLCFIGSCTYHIYAPPTIWWGPHPLFLRLADISCLVKIRCPCRNSTLSCPSYSRSLQNPCTPMTSVQHPYAQSTPCRTLYQRMMQTGYSSAAASVQAITPLRVGPFWRHNCRCPRQFHTANPFMRNLPHGQTLQFARQSDQMRWVDAATRSQEKMPSVHHQQALLSYSNKAIMQKP